MVFVGAYGEEVTKPKTKQNQEFCSCRIAIANVVQHSTLSRKQTQYTIYTPTHTHTHTTSPKKKETLTVHRVESFYQIILISSVQLIDSLPRPYMTIDRNEQDGLRMYPDVGSSSIHCLVYLLYFILFDNNIIL